MNEAALILARQVSERDFQGLVMATALYNNWTAFHVYDSRRSFPGWPDVTLCRPPELIFAELKSETGRVTPAQQKWIDDLKACGCEAYVWRPSMKAEVIARLERRTS